MTKIMKEKNHVVPDEILSKEFLSQFKTEANVSQVSEAATRTGIGENA